MAHDDRSGEIQFVLCSKFGEIAVTTQDVGKGARPTASGIADPPILQIPSCNSGFGQSRAQVSRMQQVVFSSPKSAMNEREYGVGTLAGWQSHIAELVRFGSIVQNRAWGGGGALLRISGLVIFLS